MAERRMFAKSVVESDQFLDMPAEAQALYLHLNMAADDDGFVANPRTIMRACSAKDDSMRLLIARKFVLTFEKKDNFLVVIKHWRLNNYIRKDTYRETRYKEFMRELYFDENQSYSTNPDDGHYPCLTEENPAPVTKPSRTRHAPVTDPSLDDGNPSTQDRIGKDKDRLKIGEDSLVQDKENNISIFLSEKNSQDSMPDDANREAQIGYWFERLMIFRRQGFDTEGIYTMAEANGITREDLDWYGEAQAAEDGKGENNEQCSQPS